MTAIHVDGEIKIVRLSLPPDAFPSLLARHVAAYPLTPRVEQLAAEYVTDGFPLRQTETFVRAVCKWGGYSGVAGKVLKHNRLSTVRDQLRKAYDASVEENPREAITEIISINCLAVSFGSKHLKFLDPNRAVVLDSIISERLGYRREPDDYVAFLDVCGSIRDTLNKLNVVAGAPNTRWRVSDVEMAIFMHLRN